MRFIETLRTVSLRPSRCSWGVFACESQSPNACGASLRKMSRCWTTGHVRLKEDSFCVVTWNVAWILPHSMSP